MQILLAEDNQVNRLVAVRMIQKMGHEVTAVENGEEAVREAAGRVFDLIILDVQMPVMDGIEAARAIRNDANGVSRSVPILAMTAHVMPEDRENILNAGMTDFLNKPVDMVVLREVLDSYQS